MVDGGRSPPPAAAGARRSCRGRCFLLLRLSLLLSFIVGAPPSGCLLRRLRSSSRSSLPAGPALRPSLVLQCWPCAAWHLAGHNSAAGRPARRRAARRPRRRHLFLITAGCRDSARGKGRRPPPFPAQHRSHSFPHATRARWATSWRSPSPTSSRRRARTTTSPSRRAPCKGGGPHMKTASRRAVPAPSPRTVITLFHAPANAHARPAPARPGADKPPNLRPDWCLNPSIPSTPGRARASRVRAPGQRGGDASPAARGGVLRRLRRARRGAGCRVRGGGVPAAVRRVPPGEGRSDLPPCPGNGNASAAADPRRRTLPRRRDARWCNKQHPSPEQRPARPSQRSPGVLSEKR